MLALFISLKTFLSTWILGNWTVLVSQPRQTYSQQRQIFNTKPFVKINYILFCFFSQIFLSIKLEQMEVGLIYKSLNVFKYLDAWYLDCVGQSTQTEAYSQQRQTFNTKLFVKINYILFCFFSQIFLSIKLEQMEVGLIYKSLNVFKYLDAWYLDCVGQSTQTEAYSQQRQTSNTKLFAKINNIFFLLFFTKIFILDMVDRVLNALLLQVLKSTQQFHGRPVLLPSKSRYDERKEMDRTINCFCSYFVAFK